MHMPNNRIKYYACMGSKSQLLSTPDKIEAQRYKYEIDASISYLYLDALQEK